MHIRYSSLCFFKELFQILYVTNQLDLLEQAFKPLSCTSRESKVLPQMWTPTKMFMLQSHAEFEHLALDIDRHILARQCGVEWCWLEMLHHTLLSVTVGGLLELQRSVGEIWAGPLPLLQKQRSFIGGWCRRDSLSVFSFSCVLNVPFPNTTARSEKDPARNPSCSREGWRKMEKRH